MRSAYERTDVAPERVERVETIGTLLAKVKGTRLTIHSSGTCGGTYGQRLLDVVRLKVSA